MGLVATRPFVSTKDRYSSFDIENLNNYAICGAMWVNNKDKMGVYNVGCTNLMIDLPVPVPVIDDKKDKPVEKEDEETTSGAASLAYSALVAATLFAFTN